MSPKSSEKALQVTAISSKQTGEWRGSCAKQPWSVVKLFQTSVCILPVITYPTHNILVISILAKCQ